MYETNVSCLYPMRNGFVFDVIFEIVANIV